MPDAREAQKTHIGAPEESRQDASPGGLSPELPDWLLADVRYDPPRDHDGFVTKSLLSMASVLERLRFDGGSSSRHAPSPLMRLVLCLACLIMTSLARNYLFVLVMLALVLVRACTLPERALVRVASTACGAAALSALLMLPSLLLGQGRSIVTLATKVLVSVGIVLCTSLSSSPAELTGALRSAGVPSVAILTVDLALKGIVSLGTTASEALAALRLRSVGHNTQKGRSLGGVAGVVLVKASRTSQDAYQAMRCRGFEGDYPMPATRTWRAVDGVWALGLVALVALFAYLQGVV